MEVELIECKVRDSIDIESESEDKNKEKVKLIIILIRHSLKDAKRV